MRSIIPPVVLIACGPLTARAQTAPAARNVIYAEAFGNALFFGSINYGRMLRPSLAARVGVSPVGSFPVMLNYLHGPGDHRAEAGIGVVLGHSSASSTATLGYRYQPRGKGVVFRASWTPLVGRRGIVSWAGVSFGAPPSRGAAWAER